MLLDQKAYNEQLHARKKALDRLTGLGTGGHATPKSTPQPTKAAPAVEGSMDWYEQRLAELRKQLRAAADEETARALQADYKATEQEYADYKVSIGVEAPDKAETEVKRINRARATHYEYYTGKKWGDPHNYDLMINTGSMSMSTACKLITSLAR